MHTGKAKGSQLIIFDDGTLYHIDLKRADKIPQNLFLVGSAKRVELIAKHFDTILFKHRNYARPELSIIVGTYKNIPMAAFSCGMGPGNMEIVLNEFHALFEYDYARDEWAKTPPKVNLIRVGTSGASLKEIPVGAIAISRYALGLDNLGVFYPIENQDAIAKKIEEGFLETEIGKLNMLSYCSPATPRVANLLEKIAGTLGEKEPYVAIGITTASPGFFAPEGRQIGRTRTALTSSQFLETIQNFSACGQKIINHEMETSILFRIGHEQLGYNVGALCLVLDNLADDIVLEKDYASERMDKCIMIALETMRQLAASTP